MPPPQSLSSSTLQPCQVQLLFVQGNFLYNSLRFPDTILPSVQSVSLPLTAVTLPFFIGTKSGRIWDIGGEDALPDPPARDGRPIRVHGVGRILGVAMAESADHTGGDQ